MRKKISKAWRSAGWAILAITVLTLVVYNAAAIYHAITLRSAISHVSARNEDLKAQIAANERTGRLLAEVYKIIKVSGYVGPKPEERREEE